VAGIPTGYADLDRMTCGLQPGDLIIIAGRPSMGKTALGLNIAENAATAGHRTLVFSLEMSKEQLVTRLIASNGRVDAQRLRSGQFSDADWNKMTDAAQRISATPLLIDDAPSPTSLDIRAASRRVMRDGGLALIVVDYLQLMRPVKQHSIREREVAEFSRSLKALAKELPVPVVILAQLNRALEAGATPRRPVMSDLRESGSLEQDADLILFPWREAAYCQACRQKNDDCGARHYRQAEIIIGKQRNGPVGTVPMAWLPEFCRFEGLEAPVPGR
jgi:replicative DNA helicase